MPDVHRDRRCSSVVVGLILLLAVAGSGRGAARRSRSSLFVAAGVAAARASACCIPAIRTIYPVVPGRRRRATFVGLRQLHRRSSPTTDQLIVLRNTALWVVLVPFVATAHRAALRRPGRQGPVRDVRQGADLPADGDLVRRRGDHLEVRLRLPRRRRTPQIGLLNQILGLARRRHLRSSCSTDRWNTFFLIVVMIWIQAGFAMTVLSAAIKAIPDDIVEAARLDGVSGLADVPLHHAAEHPAGPDRRAHDDRHRHAEGLRHRPHDDRRQLRHQRRRQRVLQPELPVGDNQGSAPRSRCCSSSSSSRSSSTTSASCAQRRHDDAPTTPPSTTDARRTHRRHARRTAGGRRKRLTSPWASARRRSSSRSCGRSRPSACSSPRSGRRTTIKTTGWWTFFADPQLHPGELPGRCSTGSDGDARRPYFVNSIVITIPAVIIPISLASLAAYAFAWIDVPGPRLAVRRGLRAADRADPGHADPAARRYVPSNRAAGLTRGDASGRSGSRTRSSRCRWRSSCCTTS